MAQTVKSWTLLPGQYKMFFEKPHVLSRIYFKISALLPMTANYSTKISFDDPMFYTFYTLLGPNIYFEAKGEGIFQGDVWLLNTTEGGVPYTMMEILV